MNEPVYIAIDLKSFYASVECHERQLDLFAGCSAETDDKEAAQQDLQREKKRQQALLAIQKKYGKNAILKGCDLQDGATAVSRNNQIGGHKA